MTYIYVLKCPKTGKVKYVGKANNPKERYKAHLHKGCTESSRKRGWIDLLIREELKPILEIIKEVPTEEWKYWEKYYIKYYRDRGFKLLNFTDGGNGLGFGNQTSFRKGQISHNKGTAHKEKCAICGKEFEVRPSKVGMYKCCSVVCRKEYIKKHPNSGQFKKGLIPWNKDITGYTTSKKGQGVPYDVRKKISNTLKGRKNPKHSEIMKGRLNIGPSKPVTQTDKNTDGIIKEYPSAAEAERQTGISKNSIVSATNGYTKTAGGYIWKKKRG